ncbi:MAG: type II toxin-antitoxin system RelE family toxin [Candidatus Binatia bacterium]
MPTATLKIAPKARELIRRLPPILKRKVRAALGELLDHPTVGKQLRKELTGYRSLRVGRHRVIYRADELGIEVVAIGPRATVYEEIAREITRR